MARGDERLTARINAWSQANAGSTSRMLGNQGGILRAGMAGGMIVLLGFGGYTLVRGVQEGAAPWIASGIALLLGVFAFLWASRAPKVIQGTAGAEHQAYRAAILRLLLAVGLVAAGLLLSTWG